MPPSTDTVFLFRVKSQCWATNMVSNRFCITGFFAEIVNYSVHQIHVLCPLGLLAIDWLYTVVQKAKKNKVSKRLKTGVLALLANSELRYAVMSSWKTLNLVIVVKICWFIGVKSMICNANTWGTRQQCRKLQLCLQTFFLDHFSVSVCVFVL